MKKKLKDLKIEQWDIDDVKLYDKNPRINDVAVDKTAMSIKEYGWKQPIVVDADGVVVVGHTRLKAARKLGYNKVPVIVADDLTPAQIKAYRIADNRTGEISTWDEDLLNLEIKDLMDMNFNIELTGFDIDDFEFLKDETHNGLTDEDDVPEAPEDPTTKIGDLWILGEHRLLCGDATNKEDIERLMDGKKADMIFTDPPYGVDYEGKTKEKLKIQNDSISEQELKEFIASSFNATESALRGGAYCLATVPAGRLHLLFAQDWINRNWLRQIMVWNKDSMVLGHSEYHYKHEPILFGWKPGGKRLKNNDRTKTTVWDFNRPKVSREHPTMKPVEMWVYGIRNHTKQKDIIYDPFVGSGTTFIAAEKTNRRCFGMEIDPHYCDVIINRWENFTGRKAVLKERHGS